MKHECEPLVEHCSHCGDRIVECRICGRCMKTDRRQNNCNGWRRPK